MFASAAARRHGGGTAAEAQEFGCKVAEVDRGKQGGKQGEGRRFGKDEGEVRRAARRSTGLEG